jgi:hypothetical protein
MHRNILRALLTGLLLTSTSTSTGCSADTSEDAAATDNAVTNRKLARSYAGTIKDLPIMMRLEVNGRNVSGSYFYKDKPTNGDVITLNGTLDGAKLVLDESVKGTMTGSFEGTVGEGGKVKGTWRSPEGRRSLPLVLDAVASGKPLMVTRTFADRAPLSGVGPFPECTADTVYIEVFGLEDAKAEAAINETLAKDVWPVERTAEGQCAEPLIYDSYQTVMMNEAGVLSIQHGSSSAGGRAYESHSLWWSNFSLKSGKLLTLASVLKRGSEASVKELVKAAISARGDVEAEDKETLLGYCEQGFTQLDSVSFEIRREGLAISFFDSLPHADQALDVPVLLKWSAIGAHIAPESEVAALVR